jgi:hypothetical protein
MMAETGYVQMGAMKPLVPRQGQRADAAAETDAQIIQSPRRHREQFQQRRGRAPHRIGRATAVNVGFAPLDPMQHMSVRIAGNIGASAAGDAAGTRKNQRRPRERQMKIRPIPSTVPVTLPPRRARRTIARPGQPALDSGAIQRAEFHLEHACSRSWTRYLA